MMLPLRKPLALSKLYSVYTTLYNFIQRIYSLYTKVYRAIQRYTQDCIAYIVKYIAEKHYTIHTV